MRVSQLGFARRCAAGASVVCQREKFVTKMRQENPSVFFISARFENGSLAKRRASRLSQRAIVQGILPTHLPYSPAN